MPIREPSTSTPDPVRQQICQTLLDRSQSGLQDDQDSQVEAPLRLETTVNLLPEVARTVQQGGQAVGLYRSEFLELAHRSFPAEEEQLAMYRRMLSVLAGRPLTVRTLDLRAEKLLGIADAGQPAASELGMAFGRSTPTRPGRDSHPVARRVACWGSRADAAPFPYGDDPTAARLCFETRRAGSGKPARRRAPLCRRSPPSASWVESPAAAFMIKRWVRHADFLCIGSNDLLHSLLAVERTEDNLLQLTKPVGA